MKKQQNSKTEHHELWDDGTYQTGNTTPPKKSNPLVAVLLMLVIFLGGIASALGVVNIRLLAALQQQQPEQTLPLQLQQGSHDSAVGDSSMLEIIPSIPKANISMELADPDDAQETDKSTPEALAASPFIVKISITGLAEGYGLVLSENGYILTFAHLLDQAERVLVTLPDGSIHRAAIVGSDAYCDLAVLYIRQNALTPAVFSDMQIPASGTKVSALCGQRVSGGTVFDAERNLEIGPVELPLFKTSAATGEAAGFLLNSSNQILGIISPRISDFLCCKDEGLAYVIPCSAVKSVVDEILSQGFAAGRPCIGATVEEVTDVYQNYWKLPDGLRITGVSSGPLQEGDILIRMNGSPITTTAGLYKALFAYEIGQTVDITVYRSGKEVQLQLTLQEADPA